MNEDRENKDSYKHGHHRYYRRVYPAIWMIVIGVFFLLNNFGYLQGKVWGKLWPVFIIIPALFMLLRPRRNN